MMRGHKREIIINTVTNNLIIHVHLTTHSDVVDIWSRMVYALFWSTVCVNLF